MIPENKGYLDSLDALRRSIGQTIAGLDAQEMNWNPLPGEANSLYAIVAHVCASEQSMIHQRAGSRDVERDVGDPLSARGDDPQVLLGWLEEAGRKTVEVLEGLTEADLDKVPDSGDRRPRSAREWIHLHLRHMSLHLGHMEITKQLYESGVVTPR
ncbi:MAG: DUF664 domain-containing protein [Chloroflexi bacterium]|nr:DUF664 domain-containing protein [Chloroflexota bacterium]